MIHKEIYAIVRLAQLLRIGCHVTRFNEATPNRRMLNAVAEDHLPQWPSRLCPAAHGQFRDRRCRRTGLHRGRFGQR
ncbi:protein of unknown function (plasmid) [Cupriavidus taiwanensis]|uniref:Uncharacterized protein n=1 Tax=Cupriavidus taiwanensis TaxID=164546 RepID=A0A375IRT3_9BURK|nr:protein of unknown function [Cupriavidus taiwanensis]